MNKLPYILSISIFALLLTSCSTDNSEITTENTTIDNDSTAILEAQALDDSIQAERAKEMETMEEGETPTIEEESGLSFCDCVKKLKEIEAKMISSEDDDELMSLMEEQSTMKDGECKILFQGNQSTIEAKEEHQQKIASCL